MIKVLVDVEETTLSLHGNSMDDIINQIKESESSELAGSFYFERHDELNEEQVIALARIIADIGTFEQMEHFYRIDESRAGAIQGLYIQSCVKNNINPTRPFNGNSSRNDIDFCEPKKHNFCENRLIRFYEGSSPIDAIQYFIDNEITDQETLLISLAGLERVNFDTLKLVSEFFISHKNLPAMIAFSDFVSKIPDETIAHIAMEVCNSEADEGKRDLFLLNAIRVVDDSYYFDVLCHYFVQHCKDAVYASYIAKEVSYKINSGNHSGYDLLCLKSLLHELEDMVMEYSEDRLRPYYVLLMYGDPLDRVKIFKEMDRIYRKGASGKGVSNEIHVDNIGYYKNAKKTIPFMTRLACRLHLV